MRTIELYSSRRAVWPLIVPGKVVVEVGVFKGDNARDILEHEPSHLYMVDIFAGLASSGDENGDNRQAVNLGYVYKQLTREMASKPVTLVRGPSPMVLTDIDRPVDVVYIDGGHMYQQVRDDLHGALRLVGDRPGSIIGGHDYSMRTPGVIKAVTEFCKEERLHLWAMTTGAIPSYFIRIE